jgi:tetratricopeptide (TPR) repeat protein
MKKALWYGAMVILLIGVWLWYAKTGESTQQMAGLIEQLMETGDPDGRVPDLKSEMHGMEGQQTFMGILLAFLSAGLIGIVFVLDILPMVAHKATHAIFDSSEMVERDVMHDARSLFAQGEYEAAVVAFRAAAAADPENRFPWVEIAKIQKDNLHDPGAAIATIQEALDEKEWAVEDAAYFLFRLVELQSESMGDRVAATEILNQVVELFPESRHSANALHKLREWEQQAAAAAGTEEESA